VVAKERNYVLSNKKEKLSLLVEVVVLVVDVVEVVVVVAVLVVIVVDVEVVTVVTVVAKRISSRFTFLSFEFQAFVLEFRR